MKKYSRRFDDLYESLFDGLRGAFNSIKRGTIPGVGEEGNTETYLEYWKTFTKNALRLIDNYDRNVSHIVGEVVAEQGSEATFAYERIMFLKKFLVNQAVSPWKYDKFDCSAITANVTPPSSKSTKPSASTKRQRLSPSIIHSSNKKQVTPFVPKNISK